MKNKNLLIGAGVVVVGYFLWKKSQSKVNLKAIDPREAECVKQGRSWDDVEKFCEIATRGGNAMPVVELDWQRLSKIPNEFTVKSNGFNTTYYKNIDKSKTEFASQFSVPELYKQPYSTTGFSGVMPTKISVREFEDAYSQFLKQPK
jgi:hypothetical protein